MKKTFIFELLFLLIMSNTALSFLTGCSLPAGRVRVVEISKEKDLDLIEENKPLENSSDLNEHSRNEVDNQNGEEEAEKELTEDPENDEENGGKVDEKKEGTEKLDESQDNQPLNDANEDKEEDKDKEKDSEGQTETEGKEDDNSASGSEEGQETQDLLEGASDIDVNGESENENENVTENVTDGENNASAGSETENENATSINGENENASENEPEPAPEPEVIPEPMQEMPEPPKLTLVVYMAADNDLESYAIQNLKAMEHADLKKINVLVLLDRSTGFDETNDDWTDTRLFELVHDNTDSNLITSKRISCPPLGLSNKVDTELDMGNPSVLWNLLNFVRKNYESEKYALIIWGHGTGWRYSPFESGSNPAPSSRAVAIDDRTGSYMSVHDMGRALRNQGLSVIGFDTCFGGVFENVYELKNHAEYTVASPGLTPSSGWDYKSLLEDLSESHFSSKEIADIMAENSLVNTTVFNNQKLYSLMDDIEEFSKALASTVTNISSRNSVYSKLLSVKSYSYTQYPCDLYLDVYSMAELFKSNSDSQLAAASKKLQKSVNAAAKTTNTGNAEIGLHFIPKATATMTATSHSIDYIKDIDNSDQCMFIKESQGWVPTKNGESDSLLDKLFYSNL